MNLYFSGDKQNKSLNKNYKERVIAFKNKQSEFKGENLKFLELLNRELLEKDDCVKQVNSVILNLLKLGLMPNEIVVAFDNDECIKILNKKELYNFNKLNNFFEKKDITVGIFDYKDVFTYNEVKQANEIIKRNAKKIERLDLSPLEKLLYAYLIVSKKTYKLETEDESLAQSRSVYGVLNSDKICCVGFSEYLKTLTNTLNDKNINVFGNSVGIIENKVNYLQYGIHRNNIVYIKDDKYKINGFYYLDPTWDYGEHEFLTYFLINLSEIKNIYGCEICDSETALKNVLKVEKDIFKLNATKNYCNIVPLFASSVASNSFKINELLNTKSDKKEPTIYTFLQSNEKIKDFLVYKQTEIDFKSHNNLNEEIILISNYSKAQKDIKKLDLVKNERFMWELLNNNSPKLDISPIQNALYSLYKKMQPQVNKDEISKNVYKIIKMNIKDQKKLFKQNTDLAFSECENLK